MKKTLFAGLALISLSACGQVPAQPLQSLSQPIRSMASQSQPAGQIRSNAVLDKVSIQFRKIMFPDMDQNKDGFLQRNEVSFQEPGDFDKFDVNRDAKISLAEFQNPRINVRATFSRDDLRSWIRSFWNRINPYQTPTINFERFYAQYEPSPVPPGSQAPQSEAELRQRVMLIFNQADKNLDRQLSLSEYEDYAALNLLSMQYSPIPTY